MTTDPRDVWQVEPRPVPAGLDDVAEPYADPWNSIMERLDNAKRDELMAIFGGLPTWRDTEIGDE